MKITLSNELFPIILPLDFRRSKIPISFRRHPEGIPTSKRNQIFRDLTHPKKMFLTTDNLLYTYYLQHEFVHSFDGF